MEDKRKEGPLERGGKGREKNFSTLLAHMFEVLLQRPSARGRTKRGVGGKRRGALPTWASCLGAGAFLQAQV